jgi:hypothetical protein
MTDYGWVDLILFTLYSIWALKKLLFKIKLNHKFARSDYGQDRKFNRDEGQDAYGRVGMVKHANTSNGIMKVVSQINFPKLAPGYGSL